MELEKAIIEIEERLRNRLGLVLSEYSPVVFFDKSIYGTQTDGLYYWDKNQIGINKKIFEESGHDYAVRVLAHEYGHSIHDSLLNNCKVRLPQEGRSEYSKVNNQENFAEAFENFLMDYDDKKYTARNQAVERIVMKAIFNKLEEGKCICCI